MMIQSINAVSNNTINNSKMKKPQSMQPSFEGAGFSKPAKTMRALAAAAILGMAAVGMSSCGGGGGGGGGVVAPTPTPTPAPTKPSDVPSSSPVADAKTFINALSKSGVIVSLSNNYSSGRYTPKSGDLLGLKFTDNSLDYDIDMSLDQENSTDGNLVYRVDRCVDSYDPLEHLEPNFEKMTLKGNTATFTDKNNDKVMSMTIKLDANGKPYFTHNGYCSGYTDMDFQIVSGDIRRPYSNGYETEFSDIHMNFAK